jgi:hypothetical protein
MKDLNLAWFLLLTIWPAIISNGWWIFCTCNLRQEAAVPVVLITFLLSLGYIMLLFVRFVSELDD